MKEDGRAKVTGGGRYRRVEVRRIVTAPIQRVWNAITRSDEVAQWWAAGDVEAHEGGRVRLEDGEGCDEALPLDGRVKVCIPPHVFEFTWHEKYDPAMGIVRWDLIEIDDDHTQVTLTNFVPKTDAVAASAGWHEIVERLETFLETGECAPVPEGDGRFRELQADYARK